jgi:hypothetical protein
LLLNGQTGRVSISYRPSPGLKYVPLPGTYAANL